MPGTPTLLPHDGTGPRAPAVVLVLTSDASARIWPVFTSMTTARPVSPSSALSCWARSRSATYCSEESMVSSSPTPGLALRITVAVEAGKLTPELDTYSLGDPRLAGQELLVLVLESRRSRARAVDATDERRGERAVGVGTNRRVLHDDAGHVEGGDLATVSEIERVIHHDVAALA